MSHATSPVCVRARSFSPATFFHLKSNGGFFNILWVFRSPQVKFLTKLRTENDEENRLWSGNNFFNGFLKMWIAVTHVGKTLKQKRELQSCMAIFNLPGHDYFHCSVVKPKVPRNLLERSWTSLLESRLNWKLLETNCWPQKLLRIRLLGKYRVYNRI